MNDSSQIIQPKVSVFVTTYHHENFIRAAIDSVLMQRYPFLEIVVGDDGSTDRTQDILKEYQARYPGIIKLILSKENTGITANCNRIIKQCSGKYIAFLAGDDLMLPEKIQTQVDYLEAHPRCSICYHDLEVFDSSSGTTLYYFNQHKANYPRSGTVEVAIKYGTFNGACSNMIRRSECPPTGFDARIPLASDWLFWVETLMNGGEIHFIDRVLGKYRRHQSNATGDSFQMHIPLYTDHLNSANIMLLKYPAYTSHILHRQSHIFETLATQDSGHYYSYIKLSVKLLKRWNNIARLISYIATFGYLKK